MSAAGDIEQAIAELTQAQKEIKALAETERRAQMVRALESIDDRLHEALVKLGG